MHLEDSYMFVQVIKFNVLVHPCMSKDENIKKCCLYWTKKMENNLEAIMKVMRLANGRGKPGIDLYSMVPNGTSTILNYSYTEQVTKYHRTMKHDLSSTIPVCFFEDTNENSFDKRVYTMKSCPYFQPVFTDMGMCHAFNSMPVLDALKPSYFTESFYKAYQNDLLLNKLIHYGTDSGDSFNFYLLGNHRSRFTNHGLGAFGEEMRPATFLFGLSNMNDFFGMKTSSKVIPAGHKITWNVQAMEISPSDGMKDISIESRKCKLSNENEGLKIFKYYSKAACEFEFRLFKAEDACKCVPWDMPWHSTNRYPICDIYGNYCFRNVWKKYQKSVKNCLPGCHQLKFTSSELREKLDSEYICTKSNKSFKLRGLAKVLWDKGGMKFFTKIEKIKELALSGNWTNKNYNLTQEEIKFCKTLIENEVVEVSVMFERPEFIRTQTSKRVSFPDKLGAFGKIQNHQLEL